MNSNWTYYKTIFRHRQTVEAAELQGQEEEEEPVTSSSSHAPASSSASLEAPTLPTLPANFFLGISKARSKKVRRTAPYILDPAPEEVKTEWR